MSSPYWLPVVLAFGLCACNRAEAVTAEAPRTSKAREKKAKAAAERESTESSPSESNPGKYTVPFVWETSRDEPLAVTRSFLKEALDDNQTYMEHGPKFFSAFASPESPRATVVACSESRVQPAAWDVTPEHDDFTIRNLGNQIQNSEGSVEYAVEGLQTPLLLIIGHSGCGAVRAALAGMGKASKAIEAELKGLHVEKSPGKSEAQVLSEAIVQNVHAQVLYALQRFGKRVQTGQLTVVGAIYDPLNDFGRGAGKLVIVDVNGNAEAERMDSFVRAVQGGAGADVRAKKGAERKDEPSIEETMRALTNVPGIVTREVVSNSREPGAAHAEGASEH